MYVSYFNFLPDANGLNLVIGGMPVVCGPLQRIRRRGHLSERIEKWAHVLADDVANQAVDQRRALFGKPLDECPEAERRVVEGVDEPPDHLDAAPQGLRECTEFFTGKVSCCQGIIDAGGGEFGRPHRQEQP